MLSMQTPRLYFIPKIYERFNNFRKIRWRNFESRQFLFKLCSNKQLNIFVIFITFEKCRLFLQNRYLWYIYQNNWFAECVPASITTSKINNNNFYPSFNITLVKRDESKQCKLLVHLLITRKTNNNPSIM